MGVTAKAAEAAAPSSSFPSLRKPHRAGDSADRSAGDFDGTAHDAVVSVLAGDAASTGGLTIASGQHGHCRSAAMARRSPNASTKARRTHGPAATRFRAI
ncbi:hypothetical protein [Mycobacterium tuberculosis]|uniref:hypothetical protein n=1 Tax=Mycobacterium tuberculosis TaxID=1773 RepID=UPI0006966EDE|nr:hypothetical protein [Mycobacterium tuberculosis]